MLDDNIAFGKSFSLYKYKRQKKHLTASLQFERNDRISEKNETQTEFNLKSKMAKQHG